MKVYNKLYGRQFNADNVIQGFREFLLPDSAGVTLDHAIPIADSFVKEIEEIQGLLEKEESRIYSASILLVYEGDPGAFERKLEKMERLAKTEPGGDNEEHDHADEDDDHDDDDDHQELGPVGAEGVREDLRRRHGRAHLGAVVLDREQHAEQQHEPGDPRGPDGPDDAPGRRYRGRLRRPKARG